MIDEFLIFAIGFLLVFFVVPVAFAPWAKGAWRFGIPLFLPCCTLMWDAITYDEGVSHYFRDGNGPKIFFVALTCAALIWLLSATVKTLRDKLNPRSRGFRS